MRYCASGWFYYRKRKSVVAMKLAIVWNLSVLQHLLWDVAFFKIWNF